MHAELAVEGHHTLHGDTGLRQALKQSLEQTLREQFPRDRLEFALHVRLQHLRQLIVVTDQHDSPARVNERDHQVEWIGSGRFVHDHRVEDEIVDI